MKLSILLLAAALGAFAETALAEDTNALKTTLGVFETQTGVVLIKAIGQVGEMSVGPNEISVRCKETTDASTGHKAYGLVVSIAGGPEPRDRILIDDDEVDTLLNGINYLSKVNASVTALPGFDAVYTTKAGLRVIAESVRKDGGVLTFVQYGDRPKIPLTSLELTQFYNLIEQGRKTIDSLQAGK